jgi:hypothetical protein
MRLRRKPCGAMAWEIIEMALRMTDQQLRDALDAGLNQAEISRRFGISRAAVSKRVKQLNLGTTGQLHGPAEARRYVGAQLDAMRELAASLGRMRRLYDACDACLTDPDDPTRYQLGSRAQELPVTFEATVTGPDGRSKRVRWKASLQELLDQVAGATGTKVLGVESPSADPTKLLLKTAAEVRRIVRVAAQLASHLTSAQQMIDFQEELLAAVRSASPETARAIADAVQRRLLLRAAAAAMVPDLDLATDGSLSKNPAPLEKGRDARGKR